MFADRVVPTPNEPVGVRVVMKTVPSELIIETWERQCVLGEEASRSLMKQFFDEQPALGIYLFACDEQLGKESERSQLIPLAATVWEALTRARGKRLKAARPKVIERAEATNTRMLEKLEDISEIEWQETVKRLFLGYNQQPLLGFCIEILMADDEDQPDLAPERIGLELIWLKTVIDCLDQ
jgi:hypothetical protein